MSVVEIDERGRMTVPKKLGLRKSRAIIIPAGSFSSPYLFRMLRKKKQKNGFPQAKNIKT